MVRGPAVVLGWAGHVPNDIDAGCGPPSRQKLSEAIDDAEQKLGYEVM